jgi:solute carrier family 35 protein F1/2
MTAEYGDEQQGKKWTKQLVNFNNVDWRRVLKIMAHVSITVALSQFISLLLCMTGVFSQALVQFHNVSTPVIQNVLSYSTIALFYTPLFLIQKFRLKKAWNIPWYIYPIISLCDSVAGYLVTKAYNYTSITSIQLLDCLTIPNVLVLSFLFLRRRYGISHLIGIIFCIVGILFIIIDEAKINRDSSHRITFDVRALSGDLLCIGGSVFYAISNVSQEFVLLRKAKSMKLDTGAQEAISSGNTSVPIPLTTEEKESLETIAEIETEYDTTPVVHNDTAETKSESSSIVNLIDNTIEYLAMIGLFGVIYTLAIMIIIERGEIYVYTKKLPLNVYMYDMGFSLSMFGIYTLVPILLYRASATFMNLSFLSSDLWAMILSLILFNGRGVTWLWFIAASLVVSGVIIYHLRGERQKEEKSQSELVTDRKDSSTIEADVT